MKTEKGCGKALWEEQYGLRQEKEGGRKDVQYWPHHECEQQIDMDGVSQKRCG